MKDRLHNILLGFGSALSIFPGTNYSAFIPKDTPEERIRGHWLRAGNHIRAALTSKRFEAAALQQLEAAALERRKNEQFEQKLAAEALEREERYKKHFEEELAAHKLELEEYRNELLHIQSLAMAELEEQKLIMKKQKNEQRKRTS